MDAKLKKILEELELKVIELFNERVNNIPENTSDYFLYLGKCSELGDTIDFIKSKYS